MDDFRENIDLMKHGLEERREAIEEEIDGWEDDDSLLQSERIVIHRLDEFDDESEKAPDSNVELRTGPPFVWKQTNSVIGFFIYADVMLNMLEKKLFEAKMLKEEYRDGTIVNEFGNESRANTMRHFGIYEEFGELVKETHDLRNDLVHEPIETLSDLTVGELEGLMDNSIIAVSGLEQKYLNTVRE